MSSLIVKELTCEYLNNPLGIGVIAPRLSWQLASAKRRLNILQSAYEIQVSSDEQFTAIEWNSGKIQSDCSNQIVYAGGPLISRRRYYWRVRAWDDKGNISQWSQTAWWEMGLLAPEDWQAQWIGLQQPAADGQPSPYLRTQWHCEKPLVRARLYATARGIYVAEINGQRVSADLFSPGWTVYSKRIQVQTYDVTDLIRPGDNVLGSILGEGWYKGEFGLDKKGVNYGDQLAFLAQLELEFADGSRQVIISDKNWRAATGPIMYSNIYMGEIYDARRELPNWSSPEYKLEPDSWQNVVVYPDDYDKLVAQENQPVRVIDEIKPAAVVNNPAGDLVVDMGQNMVGWVRLRVKGGIGQKITVEHAEVLDSKGNFYTGNLRSARQKNEFILAAEKEYYLQPLFTWQGFRYVRISGCPDIDLADITGLVLHTDMQVTGEFSCSEDSINQLQHNILWGQKGNFLDVPTDCPQRDERLGWTGDAQVFIRTACFNMDVSRFFSKWLRDLQAEQSLEKGVPHVVPNILGEDRFSSAAWGDAATICPWTMYLCYGDRRLLQEQYASMKLWVEHIRRQGENEYLWNTGFHYGDWLGLDASEGSYVGATAEDLIATAFFAWSTFLVVKAAEVLGQEQDKIKYQVLYSHIVAAFREEYITPAGRLAVPTQTAHVLVLEFDLAIPEHRPRLVEDLVRIIEKNDNSLTTGFVGTPYLCHVLSKNGHHDLACKLVMRRKYPSWLYQIEKGATTIWEHWDGIKPDGSFWSDDMNSFNHYAYGAIGDWLYRVVCGLDTDEKTPGYKQSIIRPMPVDGWTWARAGLQTAYGRLSSFWSRENNSWLFKFSIPANTRATIIIDPAAVRGFKAETARINGQKLADFCGLPDNIAMIDWDIYDGILKLSAGSGEFEITGDIQGER